MTRKIKVPTGGKGEPKTMTNYVCGNCGVTFEADGPKSPAPAGVTIRCDEYSNLIGFHSRQVSGYLCENCRHVDPVKLICRFGTNNPPHLGLG